MLCCPHPTKIWKLGRSVDFFFFFFFFFLRTVRELSFPLKFLNGENSGGMQSKRMLHIYKCFFKPLNTNFSKFFAQIWHKKKKKTTLFFRILRSVGRGQHNKKKFCLMTTLGPGKLKALFSQVSWYIRGKNRKSWGQQNHLIIIREFCIPSLLLTRFPVQLEKEAWARNRIQFPWQCKFWHRIFYMMYSIYMYTSLHACLT